MNHSKLSSKQCDSRSASVLASETELNDIKTTSSSYPEMTSPADGIPCYNGACKATNTDGTIGPRPRPEHMLESPWHYLKTVFLVSMIVAFVVWLVCYVTLTHYDYL